MQKPSKQNEMTGIFKGKNLIMITAEAFSGYIIDPVKTPTLYRLANNGIQFTDYYQQASAGTTGGEYQIYRNPPLQEPESPRGHLRADVERLDGGDGGDAYHPGDCPCIVSVAFAVRKY